MTVYGETNVGLHLFLTSYQIELSDSRVHAPTALLPEGESQVSTEWGRGRTAAGATWTFRTAVLCAVTILTELLRPSPCHCAERQCAAAAEGLWAGECQSGYMSGVVPLHALCSFLSGQNCRITFHRLWQCLSFPHSKTASVV